MLVALSGAVSGAVWDSHQANVGIGWVGIMRGPEQGRDAVPIDPVHESLFVGSAGGVAHGRDDSRFTFAVEEDQCVTPLAGGADSSP